MSHERSFTVALLGNPNTGKSTLFNALSGLNQRVGNYPGVTVETRKGRMRHAQRTYEIIDLPGTYSLAPRSPDEMVAVDVILGRQSGEARPDVVVAIVDASNLERNLYLATQVMELGVPVVVALNMIDVSEAQGLRIDEERLSRQLGVSVVSIQANKRIGLDKLKDAIERVVADRKPPSSIPFPEPFEKEVADLGVELDHETAPFLIRRLLLDVGSYTEQRLAANSGVDLGRRIELARERLRAAGCPIPAIEARVRYQWIRQATAGCIERPSTRPVTFTDRLDRVLTHRIGGTIIFAAAMFVVFQAVFVWAAPAMDAIAKGKDYLADLVRDGLPAGPLTGLLADGVLEGVGSVVIFLPQIIILFGFIAVLEDCGYMARAAFLMDRLMARCGLSGKSFIPLLSSMACAVPGIMATRVIEDRRDRLATILVAPLMSCSARLPVYTLLIGTFFTAGYAWWVPGLTMFCMYSLGLILAPLVAFCLKRTLLRGETPPFIMEMPLYRWPALSNVVRRMANSAMAFCRRAGTTILAAMVLVWALSYFPREDGQGSTYDARVAALRQAHRASSESEPDAGTDARADPVEVRQLLGEWQRQSYLGRMGKVIAPAVEPLGWDWRIGMAALASFPAREVVVGTLGIIYNQGIVTVESLEATDDIGQSSLGRALKEATWETGDFSATQENRKPVFTAPVALSLMVFFALCCQCVSTLVVIRKETQSWFWPTFTFVYMTVLAYLGALAVFQVGSRL